MEVSVAEAPLQLATYSSNLPKTEAELQVIESACLRFKPHPCLSDEREEETLDVSSPRCNDV
jgi:hypothetical protein